MLFRERYEQDLQLIEGSQAWILVILGAIALIVFPLLVKGYLIYNFTLFLVYALVALSLGILVGLTGQVSLGHAGFLAAGAYTHAILTNNFDLPFLFSIPLTVLITALLGVVIGLPALRLEGPYLAIATLGFGLAIQQILTNWRYVGASNGAFIDRPIIFGFDFFGDKEYYYLVLAIVVFVSWMVFNLERSHIGRAFRAVRDADLAAQMSGIGLARYKTLAFVLSAGIAGLAGALYGPLLSYITPEGFNLLLSIKFLLMVIVGGLGFIPGALIGAGLVTGLEFALAGTRSWSQLVFGLIVIFLMVVEPMGLYGRWLKVKRFWKTWPL